MIDSREFLSDYGILFTLSWNSGQVRAFAWIEYLIEFESICKNYMDI